MSAAKSIETLDRFDTIMKDHEIAQLVNELTKLMQETPDAQKRAVLSAELTWPLRSRNTAIMHWNNQIHVTKCLQKAIKRKNKHIKRLQSNLRYWRTR